MKAYGTQDILVLSLHSCTLHCSKCLCSRRFLHLRGLLNRARNLWLQMRYLRLVRGHLLLKKSQEQICSFNFLPIFIINTFSASCQTKFTPKILDLGAELLLRKKRISRPALKHQREQIQFLEKVGACDSLEWQVQTNRLSETERA